MRRRDNHDCTGHLKITHTWFFSSYFSSYIFTSAGGVAEIKGDLCSQVVTLQQTTAKMRDMQTKQNHKHWLFFLISNLCVTYIKCNVAFTVKFIYFRCEKRQPILQIIQGG